MKPNKKDQKGFTLIELMIVIVIVGILAGIGIPNFLNLKDKAIWGTARTNLIMLRSSLAGYAADNIINKYPVGTFDYTQLSALVPKANLPQTEEESRFQTGSFSYSCLNGEFYTINVNAGNRAFDALTASPNGITPDSYDAYVR